MIFKPFRKGSIKIFNDNNSEIILEFENLITPFGIEEWKGKKNINIDVGNNVNLNNVNNNSFNLKNQILGLEHELFTKRIYNSINLNSFAPISALKKNQYIKIDLENKKDYNINKNEPFNGKILVSHIWYYNDTMGLKLILQ